MLVIADLVALQAWRQDPRALVVYVAPLKALVRERVNDWKRRMRPVVQGDILELTGDVNPSAALLDRASAVVTTPEKWDAVSRAWGTRKYVLKSRVVILDEVHLLGGDRGHVLEALVARLRRSAPTVRLVALSTALASADDLGHWLAVPEYNVYNFRPSVRPVPLEAHIQGYPGKHYCPRMATMNRPAYAAIREFSPTRPSLIFVASRRQTRLTAEALVSQACGDDTAVTFVGAAPEAADFLEGAANAASDPALKEWLRWGIGIHHAGLNESDRQLVERAFRDGYALVLVATATLAWGVNLPARLVVIKGTEFFDAKQGRYVDMPITDLLQMMGRAGRPQFDDTAVAVILVEESKKNFLRKFLYEPFPVESALPEHLVEHLNAEIAAGSVTSMQEGIDYLAATYLYRRAQVNPDLYGVPYDTDEGSSGEGRGNIVGETVSSTAMRNFMSRLLLDATQKLAEWQCVTISENGTVVGTELGKICSFYYLFPSSTLQLYQLAQTYRTSGAYETVFLAMCQCEEFEGLPVRHNEDNINGEVAATLPWGLHGLGTGSSFGKAFLLLQAQMQSHYVWESLDYRTDTRTAMDHAPRLLSALLEISAHAENVTLIQDVLHLLACLQRRAWPTNPSAGALPHLKLRKVPAASKETPIMDVLAPTALLAMQPHAIQRYVEDSPVIAATNLPKFMSWAVHYAQTQLQVHIRRNDKSCEELMVSLEGPGATFGLAQSQQTLAAWWVVVQAIGPTPQFVCLRRLSSRRSAKIALPSTLPAATPLQVRVTSDLWIDVWYEQTVSL